MKVILVAPTPPPAGGIASWTWRMLNTQLIENWKLDVVDTKLTNKRSVFGKQKKNIITELRRLFSIWSGLWGKISSNDVKIVHSCIPAAATSMFREIGCLVISKLRKKKFIIHYRCTVGNMVNNEMTLLLFNILNKYSDAIIVLNEQSKNFIPSKLSEKVFLIPNFIDDKRLLTGKKIIRKKVSKALYVGGVTEQKGVLEIIEASKKFSETEFKLIGSIDDNISSLELPDNVILTGEQDKEFIDMELKTADLFLFPSYYKGEGFSNALLEAMAMGMPCIATNWAANKDMLEEKGGLTIPIQSTGSLINAIKKIQNNYSLRTQMSNWNLGKVKNCYLDNIVVKKYVDIYSSLL